MVLGPCLLVLRSWSTKDEGPRTKDFYRWVRDLHLYFGLFISPFVLMFSASVFFLNHAKVAIDRPTAINTLQGLALPEGLDVAQGRDAVERARAILPQVGVAGEIGSTRFSRKDRHFVFAVSKPGVEATVDVDLNAASARVTRRNTGLLEALAYLHKMPGPHNAAIRGNWFWTRAWSVFADSTIYLTLFISVSGLYLWYTLKAERTAGVVLLVAGALSLFGIAYAVIR